MNTDELADTAEHKPLGSAQVPPPEPVSSRARVEVGAASHVGLVRATNEDCYVVGRVERMFRTLATNLPDGSGPLRFDEVAYGFVVADGLGGAHAGEEASRLAVGTFVNLVLHTPDMIMRMSDGEANRLMDRIAERYRRVGAAISERAAESPALEGMATTMTIACSSGEELFIGHVGDSRAYVMRGGELVRLTRDHTYAQELADAGMIEQRDVERHRLRHVLSRALGPRGAEVEVDVTRFGLRDGDYLLLCSDGLTGMVEEDAIAALIAGRPAQAACDALVEAALAGGGKDNVTVVLARYSFPLGY
ncbi:MAG TPA: protein phosphatase 2C domain-containing protein [Gemmata sp.]|nr:protein phosphatase 2C domain-containing protein [Gemmata sp.]